MVNYVKTEGDLVYKRYNGLVFVGGNCQEIKVLKVLSARPGTNPPVRENCSVRTRYSYRIAAPRTGY